MGKHSFPRGHGLASGAQAELQTLLPGCLCVGHSSLTLSNPSCKPWKVFEQHGINVGLTGTSDGHLRKKRWLGWGVGRKEKWRKHLGWA